MRIKKIEKSIAASIAAKKPIAKSVNKAFWIKNLRGKMQKIRNKIQFSPFLVKSFPAKP